MVDADDEVETGADGSVVIEVQHNGVNWELGANKKGKMRDALAWTQPKKDTSAKASEQDSTAAGRHAERNAAESSATAAPSAPAPEMARADEDEKKEEVAPAPAAGKRERSAAPKPAGAPAASSAPPPVAQPMAPQATTSAAPSPPVAQPVAPPPPPPPKAIAKTAAPPPAPRSAPGGSATADTGGLGLQGEGKGGGGTGDGAGLGGVGTIGEGGVGAPSAQSLVIADKAKLQACLMSGSSMLIRIDVDASGKASVLFLDKRKWPDATKSCVKNAVQGIAFPKQKSTVKYTIKA
jgi:hypothetical protein